MTRNTKSLEILQMDGPMTLRELSEKTTEATGHPCFYLDLVGLLETHLDAGQVEVDKEARDYREHVWKAVG